MSKVPSPAAALWNQREAIAALRERFRNFSVAIGELSSLSYYQWAQLASIVLEFRPDCIVELGRDVGNSTACFMEVANLLGPTNCHIVSLCRRSEWLTRTTPRIRKLVSPEWFNAADIRVCDIRECDARALVKEADRCLVFWDAHGFEVAEWVLGRLLPELVNKPHVILMHDLSDTRFEAGSREYPETGIWKGTNAREPGFWLGNIFSRVAQAISAVDFCTRNNLALHSAAESLHSEIAGDSKKTMELRELLGDEFFSLEAHWFWFTLNEAPGDIFFPPYRPSMEVPQSIQELAADNRDLRNALLAVQNSASWRILNKWRRMRDRAAPLNTFQRRLYDAVVRRFTL